MRLLVGYESGDCVVHRVIVRVREPVLDPASVAAGLWSVEGSSEVIASLKLHTSPVMALAVAPHGRIAVSGSSGSFLKVFSLPRGTHTADVSKTRGSSSGKVTPVTHGSLSNSFPAHDEVVRSARHCAEEPLGEPLGDDVSRGCRIVDVSKGGELAGRTTVRDCVEYVEEG